MKRDEYGDPVGYCQRSLRNKRQRIFHQILLMNNILQQPLKVLHMVCSKGSGKPSGQMAAFGKQEKKPNPYGKRAKLKMLIKGFAEKERSKAGVTKEEVVDESNVQKQQVMKPKRKKQRISEKDE